MKKSILGFVVTVGVCVAAAACSQTPQSLKSPTAATGANVGATAASDGSTLKVTAPPIIEPTAGRTADSVRPTLVWANASGKYDVAGGMAYDLEVFNEAQAVIYERTVGESANASSHTMDLGLTQDKPYSWRARAHQGTLLGPWSGLAEFRTPKPTVVVVPPTTPGTPTTPGVRSPNDPSGRKPRPNNSAEVQAFSNRNPSFLRNSCQDSGGNWNFMDGVVDMLRAIDTRYGYNCKRGNCNDLSKDVISYSWGNGPDEGSTQVYCTDLIAAHCGSNPGLIWNDVTQITLDSGTVCRVTATRR